MPKKSTPGGAFFVALSDGFRVVKNAITLLPYRNARRIISRCALLHSLTVCKSLQMRRRSAVSDKGKARFERRG